MGYYLTKSAPKQAPKVVNPLIKSSNGHKKRKMDQVWESLMLEGDELYRAFPPNTHWHRGVSLQRRTV